VIKFNLDALWYQNQGITWPFRSLSLLFSFIVALRRKLYHWGILKQQRFSIPVIVVGNLTVGGTGKTPLVIHLVELLKKEGFSPAIVSRGYKGSHSKPTFVYPHTDPQEVGDEAVLLATRLNCPIVVGKDRCQAVALLLQARHNIDIVVSDDGLQHYALYRQIEIVVVDGERRFGNGLCLPIGPLREPIERLKSVDFVVIHGGNAKENEFDMQSKPELSYNAALPELQQPLTFFQGIRVHALAGIGNPKRFFDLLRNYGIDVIEHAYSDHYLYKREDIYFSDDYPVIMTEKDAVKCVSFVSRQHWVLPIKALVNSLFDVKLLALIKERT